MSAPCFFFAKCKSAAAVEKQGKALCEKCSLAVKGQVYPLRDHTWQPDHVDRETYSQRRRDDREEDSGESEVGRDDRRRRSDLRGGDDH